MLPVVHGYEVLHELGRDGMGVVYRARKTSLRRDVALKVIRRDRLTEDPQGRRYQGRFRREAEAALNHPNIVQVYEAGESDGDLYLAMELVEGPFGDGSGVSAWTSASDSPAFLGKLDGSAVIRSGDQPRVTCKAHDGPIDVIATLPN